MKFKSWKWLLAFSAAAWAGSLGAQRPTPTPTPAGPAVRPAYVRFWNMSADPKSAFELVSSASPQPITVASSRNFGADYFPVPPASITLSVFRSGDRAAAVKVIPVVLRSDVFVTILVTTPRSGPPQAELIDDTWSEAKSPQSKLVIRSFIAAGEAKFTIAGAPTKTVTVAPGGTGTIEGLPKGLVGIDMETKLPDGTVKNWTAEADFTRSRLGTLLVIEDNYGRLRPRFAITGLAPDGTTPGAATPKGQF